MRNRMRLRVVAILAALAAVPAASRPVVAQDSPKKADDQARHATMAEEVANALLEIHKKTPAVEQARHATMTEEAVKAAFELHQKAQPVAYHVETPMIGGRMIAIPDVPPGDVHHSVMIQMRNLMNQACMNCHTGLSFQDVKAHLELIGLALTPADETLRDQLKIEKGGLVVTSVVPGSIAATVAKIQAKDILLSADDKSLASIEDLKAVIQSGEIHVVTADSPKPTATRSRPLALKFLRGGEPMTVTIPPASTWLASMNLQTTEAFPRAAATPPTSYWIGVTVNPADDTLRSHLKITWGGGMVATEVFKDSPAEKAGLKKNDVMLAINDKQLKTRDDLPRLVQLSAGKPIHVSIRRAGADVMIPVTPEPRKDGIASVTYPNLQPYIRRPTAEEASLTNAYNSVRSLSYPTVSQPLGTTTYPLHAPVLHPPDAAAPLDKIDAEIKDLTAQVKGLKDALKELSDTLKEKKPAGK